MIKSAIRTCFLDRDKIIRLFDNADDRAVAFWIGTVETGINIGEIVADGTKYDLFLDFAQRVGKLLDLGQWPPKHIKSQPLC